MCDINDESTVTMYMYVKEYIFIVPIQFPCHSDPDRAVLVT